MAMKSVNYRRYSRAGSDWASLFLGGALGLTVAMQLTTLRSSDFAGVYEWIGTTSRTFALVGTFFALTGLFLVARIPFVESAIGHDRLVIWHRKLGPYSLYFIGLHVLLIMISMAGLEHVQLARELWRLLTQWGWMWWALLGFVLMVMAGVTSYKKARAKLSYEQWWIIHVLTYIAVAASFMHQIVNGQMFINHPLNKAFWIGLYSVVAFALITWRFVLPVARSLRHNLVVDKVIKEGPGVVSIIMRGRNLDKLEAEGGQFFSWRFFARKHLLVSHPYSLSAAPTKNFLRITIKNLGDHSADIINIKRGTRVFFEGPYGAFTAGRATQPHAVLIGGGVGITPLRALMDELKGAVNMDVVFRASREEDLVLREELDYLAHSSNGTIRVHYLVGPRKYHPMDAPSLRKLIPRIMDADIYMCGPTPLIEAVKKAAADLGVPKNRVHAEAFEFHSV